jgi:hypothetical protein
MSDRTRQRSRGQYIKTASEATEGEGQRTEVALHDGVVSSLVDTGGLETEEGRLEEGLGSSESEKGTNEFQLSKRIERNRCWEKQDVPLVSDGDNLTVRKLVRLLKLRRLSGGLHLLLEVEGDVAELLLDVSDDLPLGGGGEGVSSLHEALDQVIGQVSTGEVESEDGVGKGETLVDGDGVGNSISGVEDDTGGSTRSVEGEDGLDGDVEGGGVEGLEHDLGHLLSVGLGVERSLGKEDGVLLGSDSELVVESVVPDLLHVVPVGDDSVLDPVKGIEGRKAIGQERSAREVERGRPTYGYLRVRIPRLD